MSAHVLVCSLVLACALQAQTSYTNPLGSYDRNSPCQASVAISGTNSLPNPATTLLNGVNSTEQVNFWQTTAASGQDVTFDFGHSVLIDEAKYYQELTTAQGTWKWQGSADNMSYTDIGSSFALGGATTQTITALNGNSTSYRYYKLLGVSGNTSSTPWIYEFEFKIDNTSTGSTPDYLNPEGTGDRTGTMVVTSSAALTGGTLSHLVDFSCHETGGSTAFFNGVSVAGEWLKFDFGSAVLFTEANFVQSNTDTHGTWRWQASTNDSTWTDIGGSFTLGGATSNIITSTSGVMFAYRYWRLIGVSGSASSGPWIQQMEFKVATGSAPPAAAVHRHRVIIIP